MHTMGLAENNILLITDADLQTLLLFLNSFLSGVLGFEPTALHRLGKSSTIAQILLICKNKCYLPF